MQSVLVVWKYPLQKATATMRVITVVVGRIPKYEICEPQIIWIKSVSVMNKTFLIPNLKKSCLESESARHYSQS